MALQSPQLAFLDSPRVAVGESIAEINGDSKARSKTGEMGNGAKRDAPGAD